MFWKASWNWFWKKDLSEIDTLFILGRETCFILHHQPCIFVATQGTDVKLMEVSTIELDDVEDRRRLFQNLTTNYCMGGLVMRYIQALLLGIIALSLMGIGPFFAPVDTKSKSKVIIHA